MPFNELLEAVRDGRLSVEDAVRQLPDLAAGDLGFATVDLHRQARCGFPEVVFAEAKTPQGNIGIQVWIHQGMFSENEEVGHGAHA